jgi:mRNA interferase MazF
MGLRGAIVLVNFEPVMGSEQGKVRPAVVIQNDALNLYSNTTIVVPISSRIYEKNYSMHVRFGGNAFLKSGTIKVEQIRVIDKSRILKVLGSLESKKMLEIGRALQHTCDYY